MRTRSRIPTALAVALVLAVGATACEDDDSDANLSKAQYLQQANEICTKGDRKIPAQAAEFFAGYSRKNPPSAAKEAQFVTEMVVPTHQQQLDDLRALPIPEGDERQIEPFLEAGKDFLVQLEEQPSLFIEQRVTPEFKQASRTAARYGLEGCIV